MAGEDKYLYEQFVDKIRDLKNNGYKQGLEKAKNSGDLKAIVKNLQYYNNSVFMDVGEAGSEELKNNFVLQGESVGYVVGLLDSKLKELFSNDEVLVLFKTLLKKIKGTRGLSRGYAKILEKVSGLSETGDMFIDKKLLLFKQRTK